MASEAPPSQLDEADDRVVEHIDMLHARIQFLTQELESAEQTILKLQQEQTPISGMEFPADGFTEADASRLVQYATFLTGTFDQDTAAIKSLLTGVVEQFDEYVDSTEELHNASLALLLLLLKHEEMVE